MKNYKLKRKLLSDLGVNCNKALGVLSLNRDIAKMNIDNFVGKVKNYIENFDNSVDDLCDDECFKKYTILRGVGSQFYYTIDRYRIENHVLKNENNKKVIKQRLLLILNVLDRIQNN